MDKRAAILSLCFLALFCADFSSGMPRGDSIRLLDEDSYMHPKIHRVVKRGIAARKGGEDDASYWEDVAKNILLEHYHREYIRGVADNAIMFLGDGMSVPTLAAARIYEGQLLGKTGEEHSLYFEKFPFSGFSKTYCVDSQVADSACSATAYLGGVKANEGTIGVTAAVLRGNCTAAQDQSKHVYSIMKWAQDAGKSTGVVTTTRVTHASPTGTYGHTAERDWESDSDIVWANQDPKVCDDIAEQLVRGETGKKLNVIMGGGRKNFLPKEKTDEEGEPGARLDGVNLVEEWTSQKEKLGAKSKYVWNRDQLLSVEGNSTDFLLGLFDSSHMEFHLLSNNSNNPTLAEMTKKAIEVLSKNPKGYVLFVEGGRVDHGHHDTKAHLALDEAVEMAKAVKAADEATNDNKTLIVVTADHAHTMSFAGYPVRGNPILSIGGMSDVDALPYATLSYANGPGYKHPSDTGNRYDITKDDMLDVNYTFPGTAPLMSETHGGDDVAVYAKGPWAELFTGNFEQNFIMHAMCYATQIGPAASWVKPGE